MQNIVHEYKDEYVVKLHRKLKMMKPKFLKREERQFRYTGIAK